MKRLIVFSKVAITMVLVYWLIQKMNWEEVGAVLQGVTLPLLFVYIVLQFTGNLVSAWKWRYLGATQGFTFSLREGFFSYVTGAFINNFLPSTVGGDAYRTLWMSRSGKRFEAFMVVLFDRISGLAALFLCAAAGLFFLPWKLFLTDPVLTLIGAIVLSITILIFFSLFWFTGIFELLLLIIDWFSPLARLKPMIERFRPLIEADLYLASLLWSILFLMVGIGFSNFALWSALGTHLPATTFFGCIFLATLIANIPISVNNIGVKEWSYVLVFGLVGVAPEVAVTAALLSRILQMFISFVAVPWYLRQRSDQVAPKEEVAVPLETL